MKAHSHTDIYYAYASGQYIYIVYASKHLIIQPGIICAHPTTPLPLPRDDMLFSFTSCMPERKIRHALERYCICNAHHRPILQMHSRMFLCSWHAHSWNGCVCALLLFSRQLGRRRVALLLYNMFVAKRERSARKTHLINAFNALACSIWVASIINAVRFS